MRQNNKMIEEANRPTISIYFDYSHMGQPTGYFIIKNFGASAATILSISYSDSIKNHPNLANLPAIFNSLIGNTIAPNQKILAPFKLYEYKGGLAVFDIVYKSITHTYTEHFVIDVEKYGKLVKPRMASNEIKNVSYPLQEIAERIMWLCKHHQWNLCYSIYEYCPYKAVTHTVNISAFGFHCDI